MAIITTQGFDLQGNDPIDLKLIKDDNDQMKAIPVSTRYLGLEVYCKKEKTSYRLEDGLDDSNWKKQVRDGFSIIDYVYTSSGKDDAKKPVILNDEGKIDDSMLSPKDMAHYFPLDGSKALTKDLNAGNNKLTNIANATDIQDAVSFNQLQEYVNSAVIRISEEFSNSVLDLKNFHGILPIECLPTEFINKSITSKTWESDIKLTLKGHVIGAVKVNGGADIEMDTYVKNDSHKHTSNTVNIGFQIIKVDLESWDMTNNKIKYIDTSRFEVDIKKIIAVEVYIRNDSIEVYEKFYDGITFDYSSNSIILQYSGNNTDYKETINRGWLTIIYTT